MIIVGIILIVGGLWIAYEFYRAPLVDDDTFG